MANTIRLKRGTTEPTSGVLVTGELAINTDDGNVYTKLDDGSVTNIVAKSQKLTSTVRNETGSTIAAFKAVYISGASSNKALVSLAQANSEATSSKTFGVTTASIATNNNGEVVCVGLLEKVDTSAYTAGDQLWLSPTVAGGFTTTAPSAPNHAVFIGTVTYSHANNGKVEVRIQNGYELQELHNVSITSVADRDTIAYNSSTGLYENKGIPFLLGSGSTTIGTAILGGLQYANNPSTTNAYATAQDVTSQVAQLSSQVSSAYPYATYTEVNAPSSNAFIVSPERVRAMMMFPGFQTYLGGGSTGTSGTGASAPSTTARLRQLTSPNVSTAGYATFVFDTSGSSTGFYGVRRGETAYSKNFVKKFWFAGRTLKGDAGGTLVGDANNLFRCELGGRNSVATTGDPVMQGIGWKMNGGSGQAITFYMRTRSDVNGGAYYSTTTTYTPTVNSWFDWMIYYNGAGVAQMYVNDNLVGTISQSFAGYQESYNHYTEMVEQTASAAVRLQINHLPTRVYFAE